MYTKGRHDKEKQGTWWGCGACNNKVCHIDYSKTSKISQKINPYSEICERAEQIVFQMCPKVNKPERLEKKGVGGQKKPFRAENVLPGWLFTCPQWSKSISWTLDFNQHNTLAHQILSWLRPWRRWIQYSGHGHNSSTPPRRVGQQQISNKTVEGHSIQAKVGTSECECGHPKAQLSGEQASQEQIQFSMLDGVLTSC